MRLPKAEGLCLTRLVNLFFRKRQRRASEHVPAEAKAAAPSAAVASTEPQ